MDVEPGSLRSWRSVYLDAATFLSAGLLPGVLCGALVGGVGGRLAMFLLRVLSDDSLRGMKTDDDFTIGAFTGDTLFLVVFSSLLGAAGSLIYLSVRDWLPERGRPELFALLCTMVGGTVIIRPDGIDFTLLHPQWLAVSLFVALPAAYGASLSVLTERLLGSPGLWEGRWRWVALPGLAPLLLAGPFGIVALVVLGLIAAVNRSGAVVLAWRSAPVTWLGRGGFATVITGAGILLARDIFAVL